MIYLVVQIHCLPLVNLQVQYGVLKRNIPGTAEIRTFPNLGSVQVGSSVGCISRSGAVSLQH